MMKAMILAAGMGTRLKPLTNEKPKALTEILGRPMLDYAISYLVKNGIQNIIVNIHHFGEQVIEFIESAKIQYQVNIEISDERDLLLNTGGGLKKASWFFNDDEPFALTAVDIFTNLDLASMLTYHQSKSPLVTLAVKNRETSRSLMFDPEFKLVGWRDNRTMEEKNVRETNDATYAMVFSGIHIISPKIFGLLIEKGAFSIIDAYLRLANDNNIIGFRHDESNWFEFGRIKNFEIVNNNPEILDFVDW